MIFCSSHFSFLVLVPQSGGQTEMEEGQPQSDAQHSPEAKPQGGEESSDQPQLQTSDSAEALSENWDQTETPMDAQEKEDSGAQLKGRSLWKPIPPLLPLPSESNSGAIPETRDQSCQTEDHLQQTSAGSHGHNTGG